MSIGVEAIRRFALLATMLPVLFAGDVWRVRAAIAATYYVATTGKDADPGTQAQPFHTIRQGLRVLTAGDTLYLRGGTYAEPISHLAQTVPSGSSWANPITIAGYPSEIVTIKGIDLNATAGRPAIQYLIIDNLILDGKGMFIAGPVSNLRFKNSEVKNSSGQGIHGGFGATHIEFVNLNVHHNGVTWHEHGFYVCIPHMVIRESDVYANSGYGLQIYSTGQGQCNTNVSIYNNRIHDNRTNGGVTLAYGDNIQFYNNLVYNNVASGVDVSYSVTNAQVVNNTITGNSGGGVNVFSGSTGAVIKNNIIYQNSSAIKDDGVGTVASHNVMIDPNFVSPSTADFHLQATSPAIAAGVTLRTVQGDKDGMSRPQGAPYAIGAYEYRAHLGPSPTNLRGLP